MENSDIYRYERLASRWLIGVGTLAACAILLWYAPFPVSLFITFAVFAILCMYVEGATAAVALMAVAVRFIVRKAKSR